ncbi:hypothetical protein HPB52_003475 [Rhipicephalus sanguineus]|uniref:Uncharacterized protein n=1 Tax=Rhipicephalus sanguineus TaxID=34632 RepID=A0A9D4T383_RHISA|nr:hypothetical protein HPB52_003475 [Rhipicephalus sanguineus]
MQHVTALQHSADEHAQHRFNSIGPATNLPSPPLGTEQGTASRDAEDAATPPAAGEEPPPPEGSLSVSLSLQDCAQLQRNAAGTQEDHPLSSTPRSITSHSAGSPTHVMSPEEPLTKNAGDNDLAPQDETPGEITLSGPIDDTNVLAEHTQIRQLLREPATTERWDDFLSILDDAISTIRKEAKIPEAPAAGKPRAPTNPDNAQQIQGLYRRNRRRAVRVIVQGESKLCELPLDELEEHFRLLLNKTRRNDMAEICLAKFTADEVAARLRKCENTAPGGDRITYHHWRTIDSDERRHKTL